MSLTQVVAIVNVDGDGGAHVIDVVVVTGGGGCIVDTGRGLSRG